MTLITLSSNETWMSPPGHNARLADGYYVCVNFVYYLLDMIARAHASAAGHSRPAGYV